MKTTLITIVALTVALVVGFVVGSQAQPKAEGVTATSANGYTLEEVHVGNSCVVIVSGVFSNGGPGQRMMTAIPCGR
jgi:hypothetical protein